MKQMVHFNIRLIAMNWKIVVANFLFWIMVACLPLMSSIVVEILFDWLGMYAEYRRAIVLCAVFALLGLLRSVFIYIGGKIDTITRFDIRKVVRGNIIGRAINRKKNSTDAGKIIEIITSDIVAFEDLVSYEVDLLCKLVFAVASIGILFYINSILALLILIPLTVIGILDCRVGKRIRTHHNYARDSSIRYSEFLSDVIHGRESVQLMGKFGQCLDRAATLCENRRKKTVGQEMLQQGLAALTDLCNTISIAVLLIAAAFYVGGGMSVGELTLAVSLIGYISEYNGEFSEVFCTMNYSANTLQRLEGLLGEESIINLDDAVETESSKKNIGESAEEYGQGILLDISLGGTNRIYFRVHPGEIVSVCGETGCGKTYLLDALLGYAHYSGDIKVDGEKINSLCDLKQVGAVTQNPNFLDETLEENLFCEPGQLSPDGNMALEMLHLDSELAKVIEKGNKIGSNGKNLSEGQRQRLAIARAIETGGDVLVLDDATCLMDYGNESAVMELLRKTGRMVIIAGNRRNVVRKCDKVVVLRDNGLECIGSYCDLLESSEYFRKLFFEEDMVENQE